MIDVLLTDDHALVRTGIRRLLEDSGEVRIVGEADCGEDLSELLWGHFPSVELIPVLEHLLCIKTIYELVFFEVFFYFVGKSKFIS